jgi:hypothetical protein
MATLCYRCPDLTITAQGRSKRLANASRRSPSVAIALERDPDYWVENLHDVQLRNIRHAIKARMRRRGYAWLSERLLLRSICRCGWSEGLGLIGELVQVGEFYRVTARGRGQGKGRTLYFNGWVSANVIREQLELHKMPLAAYHAAERCFAHFRARVSFFRHINDAGEHRQDSVKTESQRERTGATAPDQSFRAPRGSPPTSQTPPPSLMTPRRWTALARHEQRMRQLQAQREANIRGPD